jgi:hypothetical protein
LAFITGCPAQPVWVSTCGDPSCSGHQPSGLDACDTQVEGEVCDETSADCDRVDDCNTRLTCSVDDPKDEGCPISLRSAKRDIAYLSPSQVQALSDQALTTRLARWRYREEAPESRLHVGFIIDDQPGSPAVVATGDRVDLYGYTSLAIAALQVQEERIRTLEAKIAELEARQSP